MSLPIRGSGGNTRFLTDPKKQHLILTSPHTHFCNFCEILYSQPGEVQNVLANLNCIGDVMVSMLASSVVDCVV